MARATARVEPRYFSHDGFLKRSSFSGAQLSKRSVFQALNFSGLPGLVWVACAPDSRSAYPVKALRASCAALRPAVTGQSLWLEVVHAESGAFGQFWPQEFIVGT